MKIQRCELWGIKKLGDRVVDFRTPSGSVSDLFVIYGGTGSGKTLLLETIAAAKEGIAPYGTPRRYDHLAARGQGAAKVRLDWLLSAADLYACPGEPLRSTEAIWRSEIIFGAENDPDLVSLLSRYSIDGADSKIEYFHASRRLKSFAGTPGRGVNVDRERVFRMVADDRKYDFVAQFLVDIAFGVMADVVRGEESPELQSFREGIERLCPGLVFMGVRRTRAGIEPAFRANDEEDVPLSELSHGQQQAVLFCATFAWAKLQDSVVLVDAPETYLPSDRVVPFVETLRTLGRGNQIIVATGSKELAARVAQTSLFTL